MQPFFTADERRWPTGERRLHVYLLPAITIDSDEELVRLVGLAQRTAGAELVRPVPHDWLHVTVASAIDPDCDRDTVVDALAGVIGRHEVFRLRMGSALATNSSIQLDADDVDGGYAVLQNDVLAVLDDAAGGGRDGGDPHMAIALGHRHGDAGPIGTRLRRTCRPPHALWRVDRAYICDVTQHPDDDQGAAFQWDVLATVPLTYQAPDR